MIPTAACWNLVLVLYQALALALGLVFGLVFGLARRALLALRWRNRVILSNSVSTIATPNIKTSGRNA